MRYHVAGGWQAYSWPRGLEPERCRPEVRSIFILRALRYNRKLDRSQKKKKKDKPGMSQGRRKRTHRAARGVFGKTPATRGTQAIGATDESFNSRRLL